MCSLSPRPKEDRPREQLGVLGSIPGCMSTESLVFFFGGGCSVCWLIGWLVGLSSCHSAGDTQSRKGRLMDQPG